MMTEIRTIEGGQKNVLLKKANIKKKLNKNPQKKIFHCPCQDRSCSKIDLISIENI